MNLFELGQAFKQARIQRALTQRDLTTRTGVSLSTISGLERGTLSEVGAVKLLQLFAAVGLELRPFSSGQRRTLDDIRAENMQKTIAIEEVGKSKAQRVRHSKKEAKK